MSAAGMLIRGVIVLALISSAFILGRQYERRRAPAAPAPVAMMAELHIRPLMIDADASGWGSGSVNVRFHIAGEPWAIDCVSMARWTGIVKEDPLAVHSCYWMSPEDQLANERARYLDRGRIPPR